VSEAAPVPEKPKRPKPARAKKKPAVEPLEAVAVPVAEAVVEVVAEVVTKTRRRAAPKKAAMVELTALEPETAPEKPKAAPRARRKKKEEDVK
jgi:hypothetical protein